MKKALPELMTLSETRAGPRCDNISVLSIQWHDKAVPAPVEPVTVPMDDTPTDVQRLHRHRPGLHAHDRRRHRAPDRRDQEGAARRTSPERNESRAAGQADQLRAVRITRGYTRHAEGSVLVEFGDTKVLCTASVEATRAAASCATRAAAGSPRSTACCRARRTRAATARRRAASSPGRTQEIQRLIGRALRAVIDLPALGEHTIHIDCDVLQADGGTRTASITGAFVAVHDALSWMRGKGMIAALPVRDFVAAVSVGMVPGRAGARPRLPRGLGLPDRHERGDDRRRPLRRGAGHRRGRAVRARRARPAARASPARGIAELVAHQRRALGCDS